MKILKKVRKRFYKKRIINLENWFKNYIKESEKIKILGSYIVDLDSEEGNKSFEQFNSNSVINGYEGIMIKDPESIYECKRSTSWLKSKPFIEVSLEVKNYEEGTEDKGKLGAIIAEGKDMGKFFKLNIGSGFSDKQRSDFWISRDKLIGKIIEVRADSISKSQDGDNWSLRFPRFKSFRGFESKEKFKISYLKLKFLIIIGKIIIDENKFIVILIKRIIPIEEVPLCPDKAKVAKEAVVVAALKIMAFGVELIITLSTLLNSLNLLKNK